jgi:hypothetical protein
VSDAALRELEARWRQSQSPDDEAAYLSARLRAGTLESERILLAARLGHPGALLAADEEIEPAQDGDSLAPNLAEWPRQVWVRAALGVARRLLPLWEAGCSPPEIGELRVDDAPARHFPELALAAAEAWLEDPESEPAKLAIQASTAANRAALAYLLALDAHYQRQEGDPRAKAPSSPVESTATVCAHTALLTQVGHPATVLRLAEYPFGFDSPAPGLRVVEAARDALVPWLLI